jgi:hypothetical protein
MRLPTPPGRRVGRLLVDHVRRLRRALEVLTGQVRAAVARAVGQATGNAVRDALAVILDGPPAPPNADELPDDPGLWPRPRRPSWSGVRSDGYDPDEPPEYHAEPENGRYDDGLDELEPTAQQPAGRWARAVAAGCQAAGWWLRRHPGPFAVVVAAGVGLAAAWAALVGGPFVAGSSAAVASALGVLALADAARAAATLANRAVT